MLNPPHLLTGSKSIHIIFLLIVITFLPSFLNFLITSFIVVILTAPLTISILTATVCNFLTVLSLLQTFVSPHRVTVYDTVLSLVGIDLRIPLSNLLSFGTKFGLIVVAQPLVSCSRLRRTAKGDSSMRFVGSAVVRITFNVKTLQQLSHIVVHKSSGNKLRNFQSPPAIPSPHLVLLMVVTMILKYLIFFASKLESLLNSNPDTQSRTNLQQRIKESIDSSALSSVFIPQETICDAISQLKHSKNDGSVFSSNHFIHAKDVLSIPLSKLFTAMIRHGVIPASLCDCILNCSHTQAW